MPSRAMSALFEQQGCLSPHHVFVEDGDGARLAILRGAGRRAGLARPTLPPAKLFISDAAAIRRIRERARWRGIGAQEVELFEGAEMAWTVVFDPSARFTISPGYRTVTVSTIRDADDLASRLAPVAGRLEAFAIAAPPPSRARFLDVLAGAGVTYVCDPGRCNRRRSTGRMAAARFSISSQRTMSNLKKPFSHLSRRLPIRRSAWKFRARKARGSMAPMGAAISISSRASACPRSATAIRRCCARSRSRRAAICT